MPVDCYPASADAYQKQILALARAVFPGTTAGVSIGDSAPSDHDMVWARTDASGNLIRFYTWGGYGVWGSPHPAPPSTSLRYLWVGTEGDLATFDEGTGGDPTPTTGPFWVVDHNFDARFPIAPGTLPSTTLIAVTGTGGEEKHELTEAEMPPHNHEVTLVTPITSKWAGNDSGAGKIVTGDSDIVEGTDEIEANDPFFQTEDAGGSGDPAETQAHNNIPPYYGVFFIKRTARIYYTA